MVAWEASPVAGITSPGLKRVSVTRGESQHTKDRLIPTAGPEGDAAPQGCCWSLEGAPPPRMLTQSLVPRAQEAGNAKGCQHLQEPVQPFSIPSGLVPGRELWAKQILSDLPLGGSGSGKAQRELWHQAESRARAAAVHNLPVTVALAPHSARTRNRNSV